MNISCIYGGKGGIPLPASSREVMKSGALFIIWTISSAVCARTDSICGGIAGRVTSSSLDFGGKGKGTEG